MRVTKVPHTGFVFNYNSYCVVVCLVCLFVCFVSGKMAVLFPILGMEKTFFLNYLF